MIKHLTKTLLLFCVPVLLFSCEKKKLDTRATLAVKSTPSGATVFFNNRENSATTPVQAKLQPGTYIIEISKDKYITEFRKVVCGPSSTKSLNLELKPITASVMISSTPTNAKVLIDGKMVGETPLTLHKQRIGQHKATLSKIGMVTKEVSWEVTSTRPQLVDVNLLSNVGVLIIESEPVNADVFIDGAPRGKTPLNLELEEGRHSIKVEKVGYASHEQVVDIIRDKRFKLNADLKVLPGKLSVTSTPSGASLFLDDRQYENTPASIDGLKPGEYTLKLQKEGWDDLVKKVEISAGQHTELTLKLSSNLGGIDLLVNPPGVTIYLDGRKHGVTEKGEASGVSSVMEIRGLKSGEHTLTIAHKWADPPSRTIKFSVEKGQIRRTRPINIWIADTYLKVLSTGEVKYGRIGRETDDEIIFEPMPTVRSLYKRDQVIIRPRKEED